MSGLVGNSRRHVLSCRGSSANISQLRENTVRSMKIHSHNQLTPSFALLAILVSAGNVKFDGKGNASASVLKGLTDLIS